MQWRDDTTLPSRGQSLRAIGKSRVPCRRLEIAREKSAYRE